MVKDPFHANCLPVHIGTLVELSKANGMRLILISGLHLSVEFECGIITITIHCLFRVVLPVS